MIHGFKLTDFGEIPISWDIKQINEVTTYVDYRGKTPGKVNSGILLITARNIKMGKIDYDVSQEYIPTELYETVMRRGIPKLGDVLITTEAPLGNIASIDNEKIALAQRVIKYRGKKDVLDNGYLKYFMLGSIFQNMLDKQSSGSTVKGIKGSILHKLKLIVPPLPEQQKIAEILSTVDDKIDVIDQQIIETQELKKGLMQRLLTKGIGHTEFKDSPLGMIPESWEVVNIGDVLKLGSGKDYKHLCIGTIPVYGTGGIMTYVDSYLYDGESIGIGRKGTIDKPVLLKGKFWTVDTLFYTHSFNNVTPFYVYIVFQSIKWRGYSEATGVPSLSKNIIEPIKIPLPPMEEQMKISNIFSSIDDKLEVLLEKKTHYQELKQGLMQQLLTGKIRVKV